MTIKASDQHRRRNSQDGEAELSSLAEESLGGVQGTSPDEESESSSPVAKFGVPADEPAPDAGEIEWAGPVVRKPPSPER